MADLDKSQRLGGKSGRLAVIDIGSNSIRLVVYDRAGRYPFPLFNERITCRLGLGLDQTGSLQPKNIKAALRALRRFGSILGALAPDRLIAVATAATRRADNAEAFLKPAIEILGQPITVISADEEARLIANGLISNRPDITGLIADLGGGSLELVEVKEGQIIHAVSLNLGHLSVLDDEEVDAIIGQVEWLADMEGQVLYGVGGSFRAIGAAYIKTSDYSLPLLHGLEIPKKPAFKLTKALRRQKSLSGIPADRRITIPMAAQIISSLMQQSGVSAISISGTSLRDGLLADLHASDPKAQDPLIAVCSQIAERSERFVGFAEALEQFLKPLAIYFEDTVPANLFVAACLLSDICWNEHPDMRGALAVDRVLALPVFSLSHIERAVLAKIIHHRYVGVKKYKNSIVHLDELMGPAHSNAAKSIGLALRFAHMYAAGMGSLLQGMALSITQNNLCVALSPEALEMLDDHSRRRLKSLADQMDKELIIKSI